MNLVAKLINYCIGTPKRGGIAARLFLYYPLIPPNPIQRHDNTGTGDKETTQHEDNRH